MDGEPSYGGALEDALRRQMQTTARTVFPDLLRVEEAVGEKLDAGAFAFGMLAAAFAVTGADVIQLASRYPDLIRDFVADARAARPE